MSGGHLEGIWPLMAMEDCLWLSWLLFRMSQISMGANAVVIRGGAALPMILEEDEPINGGTKASIYDNARRVALPVYRLACVIIMMAQIVVG